MGQEYSFQSNGVKALDLPDEETAWNQLPMIIASPYGNQTQLDHHRQEGVSVCVRLDLEDLQCFEDVNSQFEQWGVIFSNAMAINPSNPAFPPHSGKMVLVGSPKSGFLEATFTQPVRFVSAFVTSSRRAVLAAYDQEGRSIAHAEIPEANLAGSESQIPPNLPLNVRVNIPNIHRINFFTFDGHLCIDDFSFSF
jgi:hypothetical protein